MSLYNFHRVLIGAAIVFDLFFTFWSVRQWRDDGETTMLVMAIASSIVTVALIAYLVYFNRNLAVLRHALSQRGDAAGGARGVGGVGAENGSAGV